MFVAVALWEEQSSRWRREAISQRQLASKYPQSQGASAVITMRHRSRQFRDVMRMRHGMDGRSELRLKSVISERGECTR